MDILSLINISAWVLFTFSAIIWLMILLENRGSVRIKLPLKRLPSISIIIPAYNEEQSLKECIDFALKIDYPKRLLDIVLINDCSTDRTREIGESYAKRGLIRMINNDRNMGKAHSLNRVMKTVKSELVVCLDADSLVTPGSLKQMIPYMYDPKIGVVTPSLKTKNVKKSIEKVQFVEYLFSLFGRKLMGFVDAINVTPGSFSLYRRSVLEEVGEFDVGNLTEDMEMALRIHEAGYKIENELDAVCYTYCPTSFKALFKQRLRWYRGVINNLVKYKHLFFRRNYGNLGVFFLPLNLLTIFVVVALFFAWIIQFSSAAFSIFSGLNLIGWDLGPVFAGFNMEKFMFGIMYGAPIFPILILIVGGFAIYRSFVISNENMGANKPGYLLYLVLFPFALMFFWTTAMLYEVFGVKKKWR